MKEITKFPNLHQYLWLELQTSFTLKKIAKNKYDIKVLNNTRVKIQPKTSIKCTSIVKEPQARNISTLTRGKIKEVSKSY
jgi:hypothetical protein